MGAVHRCGLIRCLRWRTLHFGARSSTSKRTLRLVYFDFVFAWRLHIIRSYTSIRVGAGESIPWTVSRSNQKMVKLYYHHSKIYKRRAGIVFYVGFVGSQKHRFFVNVIALQLQCKSSSSVKVFVSSRATVAQSNRNCQKETAHHTLKVARSNWISS